MNNRNTGPTPLPPEVLAAMAQQPLSHRSSSFGKAFSEVTEQLATLVNAPFPALLLTCSGTGGLEASIASIVFAESRVLVLSAGSYGDLLVRIASHLTRHLDVLRFTPGSTFDMQALESRLGRTNYDAVLMTHSESSTGVYHPVTQAIATIRIHSEAFVLVDVISSLGTTAIDMTRWGADVLVGATQKGLMAPAGMAVVYLSGKARRYIEQQPTHHRYMHLRPWLTAATERSVPYTPAMNVFQGVHAALRLIFEEGLEVRYQRHQAAAARCRAFFAGAEHLRCFAPLEYNSHSITALYLSDSLSAQVIKSRLEEKYHTVVSTGLGLLANRLIRIGHMGYFTLAEVDAALNAIMRVAQEVRGERGN